MNHVRKGGSAAPGGARTRLTVCLVTLLVMCAQPIAALPVAAAAPPKLPEAKGLGPRPTHSFSGDCRDPTPDGQQCIQTSRTGSLSISPHVVQACKKTLFVSCPKITATFSPRSGAVVWSSPFGKCEPFKETPAPDLPTGKTGGPITCTMEATAPTSGWQVAQVGITGPCGSVKAVREGAASEANCAGAYTSDYYAILPAGIGIISGTVTEKDGKTPIRGLAVQIRSADDHRSVATTDSTGFYSAYVDEGDYTVCPCKFNDDAFNGGAPDVFTPRSPNFHVAGYRTQDFVEGGWQISGKMSRKVERKGDPVLSGITVGITGKSGFYREATTDAQGHYSITVPEGSYVVEGQTPPMVRPGEFINGIPWQCQDAGVVAHTAACVFPLTQDRNSVDFVMNNQYKLKLTEETKAALPGRKVQKITARVTDSQGNPVAGKRISFSASAPTGSRVVLGTPGGQSLYSSAPPADGGPAPGGFELSTDWSGSTDLYKWADAAGKLILKATLDNGADRAPDLSTDPAETTSLDDNPVLPSVGPPLAADIGDILEKAVHGRLGARPAPLSTNASLQFNILNSLYGLVDTGNTDFEPVRTADGKAGGIVLYPKYTDEKAIAAIAAFLANPNPSDQTSPAVTGAQVIDMDEVGKLIRDAGSNRIIPSRLIPLGTWATGHPKSVEGALDLTDEAGIRVGNLLRRGLRPPAVQKRTAADHALGASYRGVLIRTRGPISLIATAKAPPAGSLTPLSPALVGKKAGLNSSKAIVMELPGAEVLHFAGIPSSVKLLSFQPGLPQAADNSTGPSEEVDYLLPPDIGYDIEATGTTSGKASLTVEAGDGAYFHNFNLDVSNGRTGSIVLTEAGSVPNHMTFGGKSVGENPGPKLKLEGVPGTLTAGTSRDLSLKVVDQFGDPVAGASVAVGSRAFGLRGWTGTDGVVSLAVRPRNAEPLTVTAVEAGFSNATAAPRMMPRPVQGSPEARELAARTPDPSLTWLKGMFDPMIVVVVAILFVLLVGGVLLLRSRRQFLGAVRE